MSIILLKVNDNLWPLQKMEGRKGMKRVIIVEDDMLLALVETKMISKLGYQVIATTASGEEGYNLIQELKPSIIVMDNRLEGEMDGLDVVERLRKEGNTTPVVFISGESSDRQQIIADELECVDYLVKPILIEGLSQALERASDVVKKIALNVA